MSFDSQFLSILNKDHWKKIQTKKCIINNYRESKIEQCECTIEPQESKGYITMTILITNCENPRVYDCSMMDCDSWMWTLNAHTKHKNNSMNVNVSSMGTNRLLLSNKMHKLMSIVNA
jgi:hypothetical protein